jgi:putative copper resistance protein D
VNACYTIDAWDDLLGSRYGVELVVKVAIFAAIVGLAALNRQRLTPRLAAGAQGAAALRALAQNAWIEVVLGFTIVAIVGNLGITAPAMGAMH